MVGARNPVPAGNARWWHAGRRALNVREELARRAALAREPGPEGVNGPPARLLWGELLTLGRRGGGTLAVPAAVRPQPVMLLPGFGAHPARMRRMERTLEAAGHRVHHWGLGFNLGPTADNFAFLMRRVMILARHYNAPVALIGWSLGGLFAREIARRHARHVSCVITMGTPFSGDPRANNAWRAYQMITGHSVDEPPLETPPLAQKPPVRTVALWSPRDGVIHPRSACGRKGERDLAVALRCSHLAFPSDPGVIAEVLRQLDWQD